MAKILKVIRLEKFDSYGIVHVQLEDGSEGEVYVGGDCEVYFAHQKIKVFVKRRPAHKS